jgi:hypothetical protein
MMPELWSVGSSKEADNEVGEIKKGMIDFFEA